MGENTEKKIDGNFLREAVRKHLEAEKAGTLREHTALWHGIIPLKKQESITKQQNLWEK